MPRGLRYLTPMRAYFASFDVVIGVLGALGTVGARQLSIAMPSLGDFLTRTVFAVARGACCFGAGKPPHSSYRTQSLTRVVLLSMAFVVTTCAYLALSVPAAEISPVPHPIVSAPCASSNRRSVLSCGRSTLQGSRRHLEMSVSVTDPPRLPPSRPPRWWHRGTTRGTT
jgi:hypothetical protein